MDPPHAVAGVAHGQVDDIAGQRGVTQLLQPRAEDGVALVAGHGEEGLGDVDQGVGEARERVEVLEGGVVPAVVALVEGEGGWREGGGGGGEGAQRGGVGG